MLSAGPVIFELAFHVTNSWAVPERAYVGPARSAAKRRLTRKMNVECHRDKIRLRAAAAEVGVLDLSDRSGLPQNGGASPLEHIAMPIFNFGQILFVRLICDFPIPKNCIVGQK